MRHTALRSSSVVRLALFAGAGLVAVSASMSSHRVLAQQPARAAVPDAQSRQVFVKTYCLGCHSDRAKRGGLSLESSALTDIGAHAEVWEKVVVKMRAGLMPPAGARRPDSATYEGFRSWLSGELDKAAATSPNPGYTPTFHRLNRTEYQNTVRDLLAVEIDAANYLPADDSSSGFDNMADTLRLSSLLLERYLAAAKAVSRLAVGSAAALDSKSYFVETDSERNVRTGEMPFGADGGTQIRHYFPRDAEYDIVIAFDSPNIDADRRMELTIDGVEAKVFAVQPGRRGGGVGSFGAPKFEARVAVTAGSHEIGVRFYKTPWNLRDGIREPLINPRGVGNGGGSGGTTPRLASITVEGPHNDRGPGDTQSRRQLFVCRPTAPSAETACAQKILRALARRAYRGTATDEDVQALMQSYAKGREGTKGFEDGIELAVRHALVTPQFLLRAEAPALRSAASPQRLAGLELASRLSFFLWSSIPDEPLLLAAEKGQLSDPSEIDRQVRRMLADRRADALVTSFAAQWLQLRDLNRFRPTEPFSFSYDEALRNGLEQETELFLRAVFRENRPVSDLLTANFTYLNKRVADHYGIAGVQHADFQRVELPADSPRAGLLGHGSILTITSHPNRTSPVLRGKWILTNILGTPPPPPPPVVPDLKDEPVGKARSLREQLSEHRRVEPCASCHSMMDPPGFALENFDAIGRWRVVDDSWNRLDTSGVLADGSAFSGLADLKRALVSKPERFATTVAERLLVYALGRALGHYDAPSVRKIVRDSAKDQYRLHSLIANVAKSYPFVTRGVEPPVDAAEQQPAAGVVASAQSQGSSR